MGGVVGLLYCPLLQNFQNKKVNNYFKYFSKTGRDNELTTLVFSISSCGILKNIKELLRRY